MLEADKRSWWVLRQAANELHRLALRHVYTYTLTFRHRFH